MQTTLNHIMCKIILTKNPLELKSEVLLKKFQTDFVYEFVCYMQRQGKWVLPNRIDLFLPPLSKGQG